MTGPLSLDPVTRSARHLVIAVATLCVSACAVNVETGGPDQRPPPAQQQAYIPVGDDGMGGTGRDGMGGTGRDGMGGTGIYGTVTAFGSIIVNGLKIDYDTRTVVGTDGKPAALRDLRIGQVVQSTAINLGDQYYADRVEIQHAVIGPIAEVDHENGTLSILGQDILVNASAGADMEAFTTLGEGDYVRVSGLRRSDGVIVASRLDQKFKDRRILVRGPATWVNDSTVSIGDLTVSLDDSVFVDPAARDGDILLSGRMIDETFNAGAVTSGAPLDFDRDVEEVSAEGYAESNGNGFALHGVSIEGAESEISAGDRVIVSGRLTVDGAIDVDRLRQAPTFITILRAKGSLRPTSERPTRATRPERIERRVAPRPERPQREGPNSIIFTPIS